MRRQLLEVQVPLQFVQHAIVDLPCAVQPQQLRAPGRVRFQHQIVVRLQSELVLRFVAGVAATWAPASGGRSRRMTRPSVVPCGNTVTRITVKAATSMKSRPGRSAGTLSATASVTTPRMPAQLSTVDARQPMVSKPRLPNLRRSAMTLLQAKIQAKRASVIANRTHRMGAVIRSTTSARTRCRAAGWRPRTPRAGTSRR